MLTLYHGTDVVAAKKIASDKFEPKPNPCHWLGNGIYFYFDKSLAEWWTTNPSSKFGCRVSEPALLKVEVEIDETEILDLRRFDTYVEIANEFERFFTQLYIPFHRETISEMQIKCLFFDWYFLSNKTISYFYRLTVGIVLAELLVDTQSEVASNLLTSTDWQLNLHGNTAIILRREELGLNHRTKSYDNCNK